MVYKGRHVFTVYEGGNGYIVAKYKTVDDYPDLPINTQFTAVGYNLPKQANVSVVFEGNWVTDVKRGRSFKVDRYEIEAPKNKEAFISYVTSLSVGIGPKIANRIYEKFGESSWDVCVNKPDDLLSIKGISTKVLGHLKDEIAKTTVIRDILAAFQTCGEMTPDRAAAIFGKYGAESMVALNKNPYILCEIRGFNFATVDKIAQTKSNWSPVSEERLLAGVQHIFRYHAMSGHTCIPKELAISTLMRTLTLDRNSARKGLNVAYHRGTCVVKGDFCYSNDSYICERNLAANALRIMRNTSAINVPRDELDNLIAEFEQENGFTLAENQKDAVRGCFNTNINIITGGPGTGKSTIIKAVIYIIEHVKEDAVVTLMAPTGRASRRMQEATGHAASTIHSALGIKFSEDSGVMGEMEDTSPLETDVVIVDEVSMVDQFLGRDLLSRIGDDTVVVLVGDSDQLPSVNAGNVLHELIESGLIPFTRLNVIFRQAEGNPIIINSKKILSGDTELMETKSFQLHTASNDELVFQYACSFYEKCVKYYGIDNVVLLAPFKQKGTICVDTLNKELEKRLNPPVQGEPYMIIGKTTYRVGDKVMQTRNTDGPKNGDIGYIKAIVNRPIPEEPWRFETYCDIEFEGSSSIISYTKKDMQQVDLAFAQSIHKSQGSEYKTVIIIMTKEHSAMAKRNLLYTGVTRAKENLALIGNVDAFNYAITNEQIDTRYTLLAQILRELNDEVPVGEDPRYYKMGA